MAAAKIVDDAVANNKVVMFSKTYCPYCKMAKQALKEAGLKSYEIIELENRKDMNAIQDYLQSKTGSRSVIQCNLFF